MPICSQSSANQVSIQNPVTCSVTISIHSQFNANACIAKPIYNQSVNHQINDNPVPIPAQCSTPSNNANLMSIHCQLSTKLVLLILCQSSTNPFPIQCQSFKNPVSMSIRCQSVPNCQSNVNLISTYCQS